MNFRETTVKILLLGGLFIEPSSLFTNQDRPVLFQLTLDCQFSPCPASVTLLEKTESGKIKARWQLSREKGRGTYQRQILFKERKPTTLFFETMTEPKETSLLLIKPRPTFFHLMREVFGNFFN